MATYIVTMGRPGGGAGTFRITISGLTPDMARKTATAQFPGYSVQSVRVR